MNSKTQISRIFLPAVLLLVMIGTTPKSYLHNLFAHHTDQISCTHVHPGLPCMHQQGFSCNIFEQVINDPYFLPSPVDFDFYAAPYGQLTGAHCAFPILRHYFGTTGRSPPGLV